jgi:arylsulfatase A-like enzyme
MATASERALAFDIFMLWGESLVISDRERIDILKGLIRDINQPLFAHVHLLCTHGPLFRPPYRKFSRKDYKGDSAEEAAALEEKRRLYYVRKDLLKHHNVTEEEHWNLYDDAILSVDHYFGEMIQTLKETGKLENTLIIFFTDHGMDYFSKNLLLDRIRYPLPLIVYMPGQQERITVDEPVQFLDIAPSVLAYLDQPVPDWMEGEVVFGKSMDDIHIPARPIVGIAGQTAGLLMDRKYYTRNIYKGESKPGRLYEISDDYYHFRRIKDQELLFEHRELLQKYLSARK